jgi:hypothetical protein
LQAAVDSIANWGSLGFLKDLPTLGVAAIVGVVGVVALGLIFSGLSKLGKCLGELCGRGEQAHLGYAQLESLSPPDFSKLDKAPASNGSLVSPDFDPLLPGNDKAAGPK